MQIAYENQIAGPNHYELLSVSRSDLHDTKLLGKNYRIMSRELHPDKTDDPLAPEKLLKVQEAFSVLNDRDSKEIYDILGDTGVKYSEKSVIDHTYILTQMLVYYTSTAIFAFIMTISDTTGTAMTTSFTVLVIIMLIEAGFTLERWSLPTTAFLGLFNYTTPHDLISLLRRLFPAFMNGCRSLTSAFKTNTKMKRVQQLERMSIEAKQSSSLTEKLCYLMKDALPISIKEACSADDDSDIQSNGIVNVTLNELSRRLRATGEWTKAYKITESKQNLIYDPDKYRKQFFGDHFWELIRNCVMLVVARMTLSYLKPVGAG